MPRHKRMPLFACALVLVMSVLTLALYARIGSSSAQKRPLEPSAEAPIVDLVAPEPADKENREKRKAKGRKYDKADFPVNPALGENTLTESSHWFYGLPALPTAQSDVVLVGVVVSADAFLSSDKSGVYSEYGVRIMEVLKTNDAAVAPHTTLQVEREGGRVRLPSGQIQKYAVLNQGALRVGRKYALFLKRNQQDLQVTTGYELRRDTVQPLDSVNLFALYRNADVNTFLDALRKAVVSPEPPPPNEYPLRNDDGDPYPDPEPTPDPGGGGACAAPTPGACTEPPPTNAPKLKANQEYTVYIDPTGFSPEKIDAIKRGFEQWNAFNGPGGTNTGTKFVGFIETTEAPADTCLYCFHVRGDTGVTANGQPAAAKVGWSGVQGSPNDIGIARMVIDFSVPVTYTSYVGCPNGQSWQYNALEPTVAHEIGHPSGLNDCYPACTGSSIMGGNDPRVQSVTPCDVNKVKSIYAPPPTPMPTPSCVDADGDGWCSDADCNDSNPYETECDRPYHYDPYYHGWNYTCYNVYEEVTTYTCVDGRCSNPEVDYVFVYSYCSY